MSEPLSRRCALTLLLAMAVASMAGLLAWGPVLLASDAHATPTIARWAA
jgi:hypothetical protein